MKLEDAGIVWAHPKKCRPLDTVQIEYVWNGLEGQDVHLEVLDARHHKYLQKTIPSQEGRAKTTVRAGGKAGVHHIRVWTFCEDGAVYQRHGGFRMESDTEIRTDSDELNDLVEQVAEGSRQGVDVTLVDGKPVTHYKHGDNTRQNIAYPVHSFGSLRYFVRDMKTVFEALYAYQYPDGSLPDHIYSDDYPCPITTRRLRSCMADMEFAAATTLYRAWQAHGDDDWVAGLMPKIEAGMDHVMTDPHTFDLEHGVVKRPHTLDYWDIQFSPHGPGGDMINENTVFVINQGDTSGIFETCHALGELHAAIGNEERANHWRMMQTHFGKLGNELFWDGVKYRHHIHLDPFDHGDFDEDNQLAMSNAFAITRGFTSHERAVSIIDEYMRRLEDTGDRYPWWSLQPGYPDKLGYFREAAPWKRGQGCYANGGLFPWVGGELCRGAFQHGKEALAWDLLRDYHDLVKRHDGAVFTWYHLDGTAAIGSPHNQTNYDSWGYSAWAQTLIEELAGIQSKGKCFEKVLCSPRWPVTGSREVTATAHFPASETYFSYTYELGEDQIRLCFTGTGKEVAFRLLLPKGRACKEVTLDGKKIPYAGDTVEQSSYVVVEAQIEGARELVCSYH